MLKDMSFGILAAIDWNSTDWQGPSTPEDLDKANVNLVSEQDIANTSFLFGHTVFPADDQGYYRGFLPHSFAKSPDAEKSKHILIVLIKSKDWHDGHTYLVGFYAFPVFKKERMSSPLAEVEQTLETNLKSLVKNIHFLENRIDLSSQDASLSFLPKDKKPGKMGYSYLNRLSVEKILDVMSVENPGDKKLSSLKLALFRAMGY